MLNRSAEKLPSGNYKVTVGPPPDMQVDGASVELGAEDYERYCAWLASHGEPIQNFLPDLADDKREALLTGLTPDTWTQVFGGGPE